MKVVSFSVLRPCRFYLPGNIPGTHLCQRQSRPYGHSAAGRIMSIKNPMTPSGIEPATFRLVSQCLNQLHHCVSPKYKHTFCNINTLYIYIYTYIHTYTYTHTHTHTHIYIYIYIYAMYKNVHMPIYMFVYRHIL